MKQRIIGMFLLILPVTGMAAQQGQEDLSGQFSAASAVVAAAKKSEGVNTAIETRERAIGEKQVLAVGGKCYESSSGVLSVVVTYKQKTETYLVEVKTGRGMLNWQHSEAVIPGSQKEMTVVRNEAVNQYSLAACEQFRAAYLLMVK